MYRPSNSPPSTPRQSKVALQRQYRSKEGESFNALRNVINQLTGEELQTRQEILRKATDLLLTASEMRKLKGAKIVHPTPYGSCVPSTTEDAATSAHIGQLSQWSQEYQSAAEVDAQLAWYIFQSQGQQHPLMFNTDPTLNQATSAPGYGEDSPYHF